MLFDRLLRLWLQGRSPDKSVVHGGRPPDKSAVHRPDEEAGLEAVGAPGQPNPQDECLSCPGRSGVTCAL